MSDTDHHTSIWLVPEFCTEVTEAFRALTGADPLHASTDSCRAEG